MKKKSRILIVDDGYEKTSIITKCLLEVPDCSIETCFSANDALRKLLTSHYDFLIVDIQIPEANGYDTDRIGGIKLLKKVLIDPKISKPTHVLGLTSHQDSYDESKDFFFLNSWPIIVGVDNQNLIREIILNKLNYFPKEDIFDIAIVTALRKVEFDAVLKLPCKWEKLQIPNDCNIYYSGEILTKSGLTKSIVATSCSRMGMIPAAAVTMKICSLFKPSMLFMTGIAAGIKGKVNIGDILVADPSWDWGSGKRTIVEGNHIQQIAPHQIDLAPIHRTIFQDLSASRDFLDDINHGWPAEKRPSTHLSLHIGPVASGAAVIEDSHIVTDIKSQHRETIGVEMEAYGLSYASSIVSGTSPSTFVVKSVCDFANLDKNDDWQEYAAHTSSQYVYRLISDEILN